MKIKHSKYKNSGILFELLVRQITSDTLEGKDSPIKEILKKYFVKTELGKEYKLYETLLNKTSLTEARADLIISTLIESSKNLNRRIIKQQKYNLISEVQKHYNLNEFFNHKLPHYKVQAAFYTLLEKFNGKYDELNESQKEILKELIYSIDNKPRLKEFYLSKTSELKKELQTLNKNVTDKVTKIKVNEIISLISPSAKNPKITDNHLVNLLQYCDLVKELELANEHA